MAIVPKQFKKACRLHIKVHWIFEFLSYTYLNLFQAGSRLTITISEIGRGVDIRKMIQGVSLLSDKSKLMILLCQNWFIYDSLGSN